MKDRIARVKSNELRSAASVYSTHVYLHQAREEIRRNYISSRMLVETY